MECAQCGTAIPDKRTTCPLCGIPVTSQQDALPEYEIHRLLAEANLLRLREQHDEAIVICMRVLRHDAANAAAHSLLGDIYRDQRSYREAMGWYKLAVQLAPNSQPDRKKLDEMIDLVFRGASSSDEERIPHLSAPPKPSEPPRREVGRLVRDWLLKLQPIHLVIACTILCVCGVLVFTLVSVARERQAQAGQREAVQTAPIGSDPYARSSSIISLTGEEVQISSPPPDAVESGTTLRIDVSPKANQQNTPPPSTTPTDPVSVGPPTVTEVAPFRPSAHGSSAGSAEVTRESEELREVLAQMLKSSDVASTLNDVSVDPRTYHVTCNFTVPPMKDGRASKEALMYTGFELVWAAGKHDTNFRSFTLRGHLPGDSKPQLALVADVTAEQATLAYHAKDYRTIEGCLTDPWWHQDLAAVTF